ncbi:TatD family hydrolase [bacterium]|jgi:TatD DNase family protein|nr:TatD family hydrolase [bacterium]MBT6832022.1 TatD family hydrolase [bacterium]MBT6995803.1 TatD family hydrolase [bacterium]MBT7772386.1 TatD family hydrolase [bacterium]
MQIIDTHTHGYFSQFDDDREKMFARCRAAGVRKQIQIGCDEVSTLAALALARKNDDFFSTVGLHPCDVLNVGKPAQYRVAGFENFEPRAKNIDELLEIFENLIEKNHDKIVGIGETGFDRFHDGSEAIFEMQKKSFLGHLKLAEKHDLPLVIHTRSATTELLDFFEKNVAGKNVRGVVHCFSENLETAKIFTEKYGFSLGIGGIVTFLKSDELQKVVREIPLEFLVTETDAPFLPPKNWRKKNSRNEPTALPEIVDKIAELKNQRSDDVAAQLMRNAEQLFGM